MAIFEKGEAAVSEQGTVIGSNVKLAGALRDTSDIIIFGVVEGEVGSERSVTIGESAEVNGPVAGATVSVSGLVKGSIEATERLEIHPSGRLFGDVTVGDLIIHSGATFVGKCTMQAEIPKTRKAELETAAATQKDADYEAE